MRAIFHLNRIISPLPFECNKFHYHKYLHTAPIFRYIDPWLLLSVRVYLAGLKLIVLTEARSDSLSSSEPPDKCDSRLAIRPEKVWFMWYLSQTQLENSTESMMDYVQESVICTDEDTKFLNIFLCLLNMIIYKLEAEILWYFATPWNTWPTRGKNATIL